MERITIILDNIHTIEEWSMTQDASGLKRLHYKNLLGQECTAQVEIDWIRQVGRHKEMVCRSRRGAPVYEYTPTQA